jgi:hypothetical protein
LQKTVQDLKEKRIDMSLQNLSEEWDHRSSICPVAAEGDYWFDLGVIDCLVSQLKSPEAGFPSTVWNWICRSTMDRILFRRSSLVKWFDRKAGQRHG